MNQSSAPPVKWLRDVSDEKKWRNIMLKSLRRKPARHFLPLVASAMLILAGLACVFGPGTREPAPDETEISRSVEETLQAEQRLTEQPGSTEESGLPATEGVKPDTEATIQAQQATLDAQSTELAQPKTTEPESSPAATNTSEATAPPTSGEPISLTDMKSSTLRQAPGCGEDRNGPPCWFGRGDELQMMTLKPIFIDPAWKNPHMTFSHRYVFVQNATIYAKVGGGWEVLWSFPSGQSTAWVPFKVDLSKYQGKEIELQFIVSGTAGTLFNAGQRNEWAIRDPKIIPNYNP
jgi:hypothetical protein